MTVFPRLFSPLPNRIARRRVGRVEHRIPFDPKVELEVAVVRDMTSANSTSYVDITDRKRQIVLIDVAKFLSPTFYFEAILVAPATDNISYARLYNITDAVAVADSELSASELNWTRKRSGAITLSGSKQYKVQIRNTTASLASIIVGGRIIIVDQATPLTKTEHQIEVANRNVTSSDVFYEIGDPARYLFEGDKFDGTLTCYFEVTGYVSAKTGEFELYNRTDGVSVSGSLVSTTSTSPVRLRSSAITLTSGKEYTVRSRNTTSGKYTYVAGGAKIIIVQEKAEGITKMQVIKVVCDHVLSTLGITYLVGQHFALLDLANFVGFTLTYYYEAYMSSVVTVFSSLWNFTEDVMVSNSEVSGVGRYRSGSITLVTTKEYVSAVKSSVSGTIVSVYIGRIIIDLAPPVAWKFTETLLISDRVIRRAGYSRPFKQDLSVLRDIFSFIYMKAPMVRKFVEVLIISVAFVRRHSGVRAIRVDLSVISDVFSWRPKAFIFKFVSNLSVLTDVFVKRVTRRRRLVQNLSVISDRFQRRVAYSRKQVEVVYVQVKAIFKKVVVVVKKWLAWLTKRMKLSVERPKHAEFKL